MTTLALTEAALYLIACFVIGAAGYAWWIGG